MPIVSKRRVWVQVVCGVVTVLENKLESGDGCSIENVSSIALDWSPQSEFILFDLPE